MTDVRFTKMHGIGNDYIYIDCTRSCPDNPSALSVEMSPRHTSVGSDGIILILRSEIADFKMRIFNADGSEARMCGNGARCVGKYVYDHRLTSLTDITLETLSGIKHLHLNVDPTTDLVETVAVDMGMPSLKCNDIGLIHPSDTMIEHPIATSMGELKLTAVSMGNPHGVIFVDDIASLPLETIGRELETHPMWTDRANIEFVRVISPDLVEMRVWERGSGETMACGTGACAVAVAAAVTGRCKPSVTVKLLGGPLSITIDETTHHVVMTGPATEVFQGSYIRKS